MALKWRPGMTPEQEAELMEEIKKQEEIEYQAWMDDLEREAKAREQMSRDRECDEDEQFYPEDDEDSDDPRENGWVGQDGRP